MHVMKWTKYLTVKIPGARSRADDGNIILGDTGALVQELGRGWHLVMAADSSLRPGLGEAAEAEVGRLWCLNRFLIVKALLTNRRQ